MVVAEGDLQREGRVLHGDQVYASDPDMTEAKCPFAELHGTPGPNQHSLMMINSAYLSNSTGTNWGLFKDFEDLGKGPLESPLNHPLRVG